MTIRTKSSEELSHLLHEYGREWAVAENQWFWVQEQKKVMLSSLALQYEKAGSGITKAEKSARVDPIFTEHLEAMKEANHNRNMTRVKYEEVQVEIRRRLSKSFHDRQEHASGRLVP